MLYYMQTLIMHVLSTVPIDYYLQPYMYGAVCRREITPLLSGRILRAHNLSCVARVGVLRCCDSRCHPHEPSHKLYHDKSLQVKFIVLSLLIHHYLCVLLNVLVTVAYWERGGGAGRTGRNSQRGRNLDGWKRNKAMKKLKKNTKKEKNREKI